MSAELFAVFAATSFLITASPGPIILYATQAAMARGFAIAWIITPAILLGDASAMAISLTGVGALVASSPSMRLPIQLLGAGALILIGAQSLRSVNLPASEPAQAPASGQFLSSYLLAALHPGAFIFYMAYFPQFIEPGRSVGPQIALLAATFLLLAGLSILIWMALAALASRLIANTNVKALFARVSAVVLIAVGGVGLFSSLR